MTIDAKKSGIKNNWERIRLSMRCVELCNQQGKLNIQFCKNFGMLFSCLLKISQKTATTSKPRCANGKNTFIKLDGAPCIEVHHIVLMDDGARMGYGI